jgi:hypothetical protein
VATTRIAGSGLQRTCGNHPRSAASPGSGEPAHGDGQTGQAIEEDDQAPQRRRPARAKGRRGPGRQARCRRIRRHHGWGDLEGADCAAYSVGSKFFQSGIASPPTPIPRSPPQMRNRDDLHHRVASRHLAVYDRVRKASNQHSSRTFDERPTFRRQEHFAFLRADGRNELRAESRPALVVP